MIHTESEPTTDSDNETVKNKSEKQRKRVREILEDCDEMRWEELVVRERGAIVTLDPDTNKFVLFGLVLVTLLLLELLELLLFVPGACDENWKVSDEVFSVLWDETEGVVIFSWCKSLSMRSDVRSRREISSFGVSPAKFIISVLALFSNKNVTIFLKRLLTVCAQIF